MVVIVVDIVVIVVVAIGVERNLTEVREEGAKLVGGWSVVGQGDSKRDIDSMYVLKCININSRRYSFYEFQVSWSKFQEVNTYCKVLKAIRYFYSSVDTCVGYHLVKYELFIRIAHVCPGAIVYFSDMFRYQP